MDEIPVYLFTGFMDSGKTSLIMETLLGNEFGAGCKNLILMCEDGEVEYDEEKLKEINTDVLCVNSQEEFNEENLKLCDLQYRPDQVFIEYNGTWELSVFLETKLPKGWVLVQSLATADASTFEVYMSNMRPMMMEQLFQADVCIFNRCTPDTPKGKFRRMVKAVNRKAQMVYELEDGTIDESDAEELPYDMSSDYLDITDADYGLWYLDALDHAKNYEGKTVHFLAKVYRPEKLKKGIFVPGRFAMTCCEEDITFIGFKCKSDQAEQLEHKSWIEITAKVHIEFAKEYKGKGPVLYLEDWKPAEKPEDELVYFS
jgi:uncharacterized membrane protein YcgQ (UPF0703/DUF1980 family)